MEKTAKIFTLTLLTVILVASVISYEEWSMAYSQGQSNGFIVGVNTGYTKGQTDTLDNIKGILKSGGIVMNWSQQSDGNYLIQVLSFSGNTVMSETAKITPETFNVLNVSGLIGDNHVPPKIAVNVDWDFQINTGVGVVDYSGSSGNLITNEYAYLLANMTVGLQTLVSGTNGTVYIALGNTTTNTYTDTQLGQEATGSGFIRSAALTPTYASGTGIGSGTYYNCSVSNKFQATATIYVNGTSLNWLSTSNSAGNMAAEASIGSPGQTFNNLDNCTITWTWTVSH